MLNSPLPVRVAALWPVAPVRQDSFTWRMPIVMQDTARWDGIPPCALARGSDRCAPTLPSSAHEQWRPKVLVELRAPDADEKNCETNPITSAGILVVPEIEGQRNPANASAGSCQTAHRRAGASVRKLRGRCAQRWIRRRLASTWSAPSGISIRPSCSKLSASYTAMSPMVPPT